MGKFILKIIPGIFFWGIFTFIILQVPYPQSLTQASFTQILTFFISLFLAFVFTFNIFLKNIYVSASIALGIIFILILQALDSLNLVTGILTVVAVTLLISYFRKIKRSHLTKLPKIPKLTQLRRK